MGVHRATTIILRSWVLLSLGRYAPIEAEIPSTSLLEQSTLLNPKAYNLTLLSYNNLQEDFQQRKRRQTDEGLLCGAPLTPIPNSVVDMISEGRSAVFRCLKNHRTEFNVTSFRMECIDGDWMLLDLPEGISQVDLRCSPSCNPPCQRGDCLPKSDKTGTFCKCPDMYSGKACEIAGCKSFPVVNRIVLEWNEMQQDEEKDVGPPIIRTSEVTGKCYEGAYFKIPALSSYTKDRPPFNELKFKCDQGSWKVLIPSENVYTDFDKAECEYSCYPQCQNGGSCILSEDSGKSCQCMPGFTGDYCELKMCDYDVILEDYTWDIPLPASSHYTGHIWKECPAGYIHPSTGNRSYIETCENGEWIKPDGRCEPLCSPSCMNDGICIQPNLCACPFGLAGSYCQIQSCLNAWSPTLKNAIYRTEVHRLNITCKKGYSYPSGDSSMVFDCLEGNWDFREKKPQPCIPTCISTPCLNGGTCIWPSTCKCRNGFTGSQCEKEMCPLPPKYLHNALGNLSNPEELIYTIECNKGYELITHKTSLEVKCEEGMWQFPKGLEDSQFIDCRPVCTKPCFNGGRCVAPDLCRCPEGFTGPQCTKRYENTVEEATKCQFPFMYKRVWYYSCTMFGYHLPWCATNVSATGAMTKWSTCLADSYRARVRLTVDGQLCRFPFRHKDRLHYTCTTHESTEPWCATSVDENNEVVQKGACAQHVIQAKELILTTEGEECGQQFLPGEEKYEEMITEGDTYGLCYTKTVISQLTIIETSVRVKQSVRSVLIDSGYTRNGVTKSGRSCQFPFTLGGERFFGCVVTAHRPAWCLAEDSDSYGSGILKSEECTDPSYLETEIKELTLTNALPNSTASDRLNTLGSVRVIRSLSGQRCIFPFRYLGENHYGCIYKGAANPWCATKIDSEGNAMTRDACPKDWDTQSHMEHLVTLLAANKNISMSKSGLRCQPFELDGQLVQGCVKGEGQLPWCAVAVNSRREAVTTDFCVEVGENNTGLIAKTEFIDYINMLFTREPKILDPSTREEYTLYSVNGSRCKPFLHDNEMQHGCIEEEGKRPWCATSVSDDALPADVDSCPYSWKFWRYMLSVDPSFWSPYSAGMEVTMTESGQQCVFPFIHKNKMYHQCVESENRRSWCATAIDNDGFVLQQDVCRERKGLLKSASGKTCVPFLQEGILEGGCLKPPNAREWCAVHVDDLGLLVEKDLCTPDWNNSRMQVPLPERDAESYGKVVSLQTVNGESCIPFLHEGVIVRHCVETEGEDQAWCATSTDEDGNYDNKGVCVKDWRDMIWPPGTQLKENITNIPDDNGFGFYGVKEKGIAVNQNPNTKDNTTIIINVTRAESLYGPALSLMNPTALKFMIYINATANFSKTVPFYDYASNTMDNVMLNELVLATSDRSGIEPKMVEELLSFIFMPLGSNFQLEIADHPDLDPYLHDLLSNLTNELGVDHSTPVTIDIILDNEIMNLLAIALGIGPRFPSKILNTDGNTNVGLAQNGQTTQIPLILESITVTTFTNNSPTNYSQVADSTTTKAFTNNPATNHTQVTDSKTPTTFTNNPATNHAQVTESAATTQFTNNPATYRTQVTDSITTKAFTNNPATNHTHVTDSMTTTSVTSNPTTNYTQFTDSITTTVFTNNPPINHTHITDSITATTFTNYPATNHSQVTNSLPRTQASYSSVAIPLNFTPEIPTILSSVITTTLSPAQTTSKLVTTPSVITQTATNLNTEQTQTQISQSSTASDQATETSQTLTPQITTILTSPVTKTLPLTPTTLKPVTVQKITSEIPTTSDPEVTKSASGLATSSTIFQSPMPNSSLQILTTKEPETAHALISNISTTPLPVATETLLHSPSPFEVKGVAIQNPTPHTPATIGSKTTRASASTTHIASKSATTQKSTDHISTALGENENQTLSQTSKNSKQLTTQALRKIPAPSELATAQILTTQMTPASKHGKGPAVTSTVLTSFNPLTTRAFLLTSIPVALKNLTQISTSLKSGAAHASKTQVPTTSMPVIAKKITSQFPITSKPVTFTDHWSDWKNSLLEGEGIDWQELGALPSYSDEYSEYEAEDYIEITRPPSSEEDWLIRPPSSEEDLPIRPPSSEEDLPIRPPSSEDDLPIRPPSSKEDWLISATLTTRPAGMGTRSDISSTVTSTSKTPSKLQETSETTTIMFPQITSAVRIGEHTTIEGLLCAFPFKYNGQIYDHCTSADAAAPWCPIRVNSRLRPIVTGYCSGYGDMPSEPSPKFLPMTLDNQMCQFPFVWKNTTYYWCTSTGRPSPWCATQLDELNRPLASGYCFDSLKGPVPSEPPPTIYEDEDVDQDKCVFPFVYKGKTYRNCTKEDSVLSWCAYEVDSLKQPTKVGCCSGEPMEMKSVSGKKEERVRKMTENGEECQFPFLHHGEWHYTCIWTPGTERPWCVTRFDRFGRPLSSGYCLGGSIAHPMLGGGANDYDMPNGGSASYPVPYGGSGPYPVPGGASGPYPVPGGASGPYAVPGGASGPYPVPGGASGPYPVPGGASGPYPVPGGGSGPYPVPGGGSGLHPVPGGGLQSRYVQEGGSNDYYMPDGGPSSYPVPGGDSAAYPVPGGDSGAYPVSGGGAAIYPMPDGNSTAYAVPVGPQTIFTTRSKKCVFPFWYSGRWYSDCTDADHHKPWCAIAVNARGVVISAEYCSLGVSLSTEADLNVTSLNVTENGIKCALPFLYGGKKFCQCTTEGDTRPWCATSIDEDRHVVTRGYCKVKIPGTEKDKDRRPKDGEKGPGVKESGSIYKDEWSEAKEGTPKEKEREPVDKDEWPEAKDGGQDNEGDLKINKNSKEEGSNNKDAKAIESEVEWSDKEGGMEDTMWEPMDMETAIDIGIEGPKDTEGGLIDEEGRPKYNDEGEPSNREEGSNDRWPIYDEAELSVKEEAVDDESGLNKGVEWNDKEKGPNSNERVPEDDDGPLRSEPLVSLVPDGPNEGLATSVSEHRPSVITVNHQRCVFPFHYKGIRYEHCACLDAPACWCATSLTLDLQPATSDYCRDFIFSSVPAIPSPALGEGAMFTVSGCKCSLPFVYKGVTHTRCITEDSTYPWCPILVNEQRNPISTAYCRNDKYGDAPRHPPPPGSDTQVPQI